MEIKNWNWQRYKNKNKDRIFETVAQYLSRGNNIKHLSSKTNNTSFQYTQPKTKRFKDEELRNIVDYT